MVVQTEFILGRLEAVFDCPAMLLHLDENI